MGYRSDVGLVLSATGFSHLLGKGNKLINECLESADKVEKNADSGEHLYIWTYVEWSMNNGGIAQLMIALDSVDNNDYAYVKLGEDSTDIEAQGNLWDNDFGFGYIRKLQYDNMP